MGMRQSKPIEEPIMNQEKLQQSCKYCEKILDVINAPEVEEYEVELGTVAEVLPFHNECPNHGTMLEGALTEYSGRVLTAEEKEAYTERADDKRMLRAISFEHKIGIQFLIWHDTYQMDFPLKLQKKMVYNPIHSNHNGDAMILDNAHIDMGLIKRWRRECHETHDKCRIQRKISGEASTRPQLFIDTQNYCIVSSEGIEDGFVALSYCWGQPEPGKPYWFRNEKAILADLQQTDALTPDSKFGSQLPQTIRDTIAIVRQIGERYLWIDSLCIVQDDFEMKSIELPKMSEIYAEAVLTIIAANGPHADSGIAGFDFTKPRMIDQKTVTIGSEQLLTPIEFLHNKSGQYVGVAYYTRGWTFQEYEFGRRRLIFEQQSVRWECRQASWCEDLKDKAGLEYKGIKWDTDSYPNPGIEDLNEVINLYNIRELGRQEDAFPAFCGFQRVLSRSYPQGFINGMPIAYFDVAMCWIPQTEKLERRKAYVSGLDPPSWSWLGWTGTLEMVFSSEAETIKDQTYSNLHVEKLVDWFSMTSLEAPKVPIRESAQLDTKTFSLAKEPSLLFCNSQSASFKLGNWFYESEEDLDFYGPWIHIQNQSGDWCGMLRLNQKEDLASLKESDVELVAISKGHAPELEPQHELYGLTEWKHPERPRDGSHYHYYNVLCIERKDGVAYRKAIGRIAKSRWESTNLSQIAIVLA
jgi:hypothetical protein